VRFRGDGGARTRAGPLATVWQVVTKVISVPPLSVTFGTARKGSRRASFRPMETIATITTYAAVTCLFALIGIIWRHTERADEAVKLQRHRITD